MRIFISGGCKNGKSYYAQRLAKAQQSGKLYYIATMKPSDEEDEKRIERHRREREGWGFETLELPENILSCLNNCDLNNSVLLDSVTAVLANAMFLPDGRVDSSASRRIADDIHLLCTAFKNIVIVSDYIYSDAEKYDALTEEYRKGLAYIDKRTAKICDVVLEVVYGNVIIHKGGEVFERLYESIN